MSHEPWPDLLRQERKLLIGWASHTPNIKSVLSRPHQNMFLCQQPSQIRTLLWGMATSSPFVTYLVTHFMIGGRLCHAYIQQKFTREHRSWVHTETPGGHRRAALFIAGNGLWSEESLNVSTSFQSSISQDSWNGRCKNTHKYQRLVDRSFSSFARYQIVDPPWESSTVFFQY